MNDTLAKIVAKTPDQKRIAKLEKEVETLKSFIKDLEEDKRNMEYSLESERRWRMDFQRLMKSATQEDNLTEYERRYW